MLWMVITDGPRHAVEAQVGGGEAGLPVVGVDEVGEELRDHAHGDVGGGAAEGAEAAPVVGVVAAGRVAVGAAGAVVERRAVDDDELEALDLAARRRAGTPRSDGVVVEDAGLAELRHHGGVAGEERAHLDAAAGERRRQGAGDVGEAAGLDERVGLGGDGEDAHQDARVPDAARLRRSSAG